MKNEKTTCIAAHRFPSNKKICTYSLDRNALLSFSVDNTYYLMENLYLLGCAVRKNKKSREKLFSP